MKDHFLSLLCIAVALALHSLSNHHLTLAHTWALVTSCINNLTSQTGAVFAPLSLRVAREKSNEIEKEQIYC